MSNETITTKVIEIPFWKAISVISGAVLVSIVGTAFTVGTVLNSDHFLLANTVDQVNELKVKKADSAIIEYRLNEIDKKLSSLDSKIDSLALRSSTSKSTVASVRTVSRPQTVEPQQHQAQTVSVEQIQPQPEPAPSPKTPGKSENSRVLSTPILKIDVPPINKLLGGD